MGYREQTGPARWSEICIDTRRKSRREFEKYGEDMREKFEESGDRDLLVYRAAYLKQSYVVLKRSLEAVQALQRADKLSKNNLQLIADAINSTEYQIMKTCNQLLDTCEGD